MNDKRLILCFPHFSTSRHQLCFVESEYSMDRCMHMIGIRIRIRSWTST